MISDRLRARLLATLGLAAIALVTVALPVRVGAEHDPLAYGFGTRSGVLDSGMHYVLHPVGELPVVAMQLWFRVPSTGFDAPPQPSIALYAARSVAAATPVGGASLETAVAAVGGSLQIDASADAVSVAVTAPSAEAPALLAALRAAYAAPLIDDAGMKQALASLARQALLHQVDPLQSIQDAIFSQLFVSGAAHEARFDLLSLSRVTSKALHLFAQRAFRPSNTILVVSGAVDPTLLTLPTHLPTTEADVPERVIDSVPRVFDGTPFASSSVLLPLSTQQIDGVLPGIGYGWLGPPIRREADATALDFLADYLFDPTTGLIARRFQEHGIDAWMQGQFITLHGAGVFTVGVVGLSTDRLMPSILGQALKDLEQPLDDATFSEARALFWAHLVRQIATPDGYASSIGWYAAEDDPLYAPGVDGETGEYARMVEELTPRSVAAVVRRYLTSVHPACVQVHTSHTAMTTPS